MYFTEEERKEIIRSLSKSQRHALHIFSRLSKQSYFANVLASHKGTERFMFDGYVDHGGVKKGVTCLCGKSLRYEFILRDIKSGQKISLGRTHFQRELDIPDHIARQVHKGIHQINIELDEILDKLRRNDTKLPQSIVDQMKKIKLNEEVKCLLNAKLPLLRRHIAYLFDVTKQYRQKNNQAENRNDESIDESYKVFRDIHIGKIPYKEFIEENYGNVIDEYILKTEENWKRTTSNIISHLVSNAGLSDLRLLGRNTGDHALEKYFNLYLSEHPNYIEQKIDNYKPIYFYTHINNKGLNQEESIERLLKAIYGE